MLHTTAIHSNKILFYFISMSAHTSSAKKSNYEMPFPSSVTSCLAAYVLCFSSRDSYHFLPCIIFIFIYLCTQLSSNIQHTEEHEHLLLLCFFFHAHILMCLCGLSAFTFIRHSMNCYRCNACTI